VGPVESATRATVKGLGTLSASQTVTAETAIRLSALLDTECDGSKASALAARLLSAVAALTSTAPAAGGRDRIEQIQDDLARRRAGRAG
jgi:hypothetical protein